MAGCVESVWSRAPRLFAISGQICICLIPFLDWMPAKAVCGGGKGMDLGFRTQGSDFHLSLLAS